MPPHISESGQAVVSGIVPALAPPPHLRTYSWLPPLHDFFFTSMPAFSIVKSAAVILTQCVWPELLLVSIVTSAPAVNCAAVILRV